ncbi:hypothetical protein BS78_05G272700 [Paspalum vaginatum]|nr:hypothetical protein BS78_05G272700 [Paspalum vaginatum]
MLCHHVRPLCRNSIILTIRRPPCFCRNRRDNGWGRSSMGGTATSIDGYGRMGILRCPVVVPVSRARRFWWGQHLRPLSGNEEQRHWEPGGGPEEASRSRYRAGGTREV